MRRQLSAELGRHGVQVVTLGTGGVPESMAADETSRQEIVDAMTASTTLGRVATLHDVGHVAAFVASDRARTMTVATVKRQLRRAGRLNPLERRVEIAESATSSRGPQFLVGSISRALRGSGDATIIAVTTIPAATPWWHDAVIYQIYLRSFADSDGDGIGDLAGLRSRLDYLVDLCVDGLWLNPHYPSPQVDAGYDVADYTGVDPSYGDLAEFDGLLADAHERQLRVVVDIVPNHCSSAHPWFVGALAAAPGSPERARFLFRDGRGAGGDLPPNNWQSRFGGPAWTRVTEADGRLGQWYLHLFDPAQPDFDWRNPQVADLFDDVLRFWFDRGVDGVRIDVARGLVKNADLPDWDPTSDPRTAPMWNQPGVHDVYRRWRALADGYRGRELTLVAEAWVADPAALADYLRPDELQQAFYFDLLVQPWRAPDLRAAIDRGLAIDAVPTWTLANHDVHRAVTRYGQDQALTVIVSENLAAGARSRTAVDVDLGTRRARGAALLLLALPGSAYLYQGEELGLPEVLDLPADARQDPVFAKSAGTDLGRDGCRVPLPWQAGASSFGFSPPDAEASPWLPQPSWFGGYAVDRQRGRAGSMHLLYRDALNQRRGRWPGGAGGLHWLTATGRDDVLAFRRGRTVVVAVCGDAAFRPPEDWGRPGLASADVGDDGLPGWSAAWLDPVTGR